MFDRSTLLRHTLDRELAAKVVICSVGGQWIAQLENAVQLPGYYDMIWDD